MIRKVKDFCLELTNHCNLNCNFCTNSIMTREKGFMDITFAKRIISEVKKNKFSDRIALHLMGEPLLHEGLFEILAYANSIKQNIVLVTNGSLLNQETALRLFESPPEVVAISYHSGSCVSSGLQNPSISYDEYKKKIFEFIELKFKLRAKTYIDIHMISTIYKAHSEFKILDTSEELHQFEKDWIEFSHYIKQKYSLRYKVPHLILAGRNYMLPGLSITLRHSYHSWANAILPTGTKVVQSGKCHCPLGFTQCNVMWNGDLTPCYFDYNGDLVYDNARDKNIIKAFNSESAEKMRDGFRGKGAVHKKCSYCRGVVKRSDGTEYSAISRTFEPPRLEELKVKYSFFNKVASGFYTRMGWQIFKQKMRNSLKKLKRH